MFNEGSLNPSEYIFVYRDGSMGLVGFAQAPDYETAKLLQSTMLQSGLTELGNKWRFQDIHPSAKPDKPKAKDEASWN